VLDRLATRIWPLAAAATLVACDGPEDRPARWSYVHTAILRPACATAGCHSQLTAQAGLDLSTRDSAYVYLTGHSCDPTVPGQPPGNYVFPGEPERSRLIYLLRGDGVRTMPPDLPLPEVEIELVERWILEGARCD